MPLPTWWANNETNGLREFARKAMGLLSDAAMTSVGQTPGGVALSLAAPILENKNVQDILNATGPGNPVDDAILGASKLTKFAPRLEDASPLMGIVSAPTLKRYWNDLYKLDEAGAPIIRKGEAVVGENLIEKALRQRASLGQLKGDEAENAVMGGRNAIEDALNNPNLKAPADMDEWDWLIDLGRKAVDRIKNVEAKTADVSARGELGETATSGIENLASKASNIEEVLMQQQAAPTANKTKISKAQALFDLTDNPNFKGLLEAAARNSKSPAELKAIVEDLGGTIGYGAARYRLNNDVRARWMDPIARPIERNRQLTDLNYTQLSERAQSLKRMLEDSPMTGKSGGRMYRASAEAAAEVANQKQAGEITTKQAEALRRVFRGANPNEVVKYLAGSDRSKENLKAGYIEINRLMEKTLFRLGKKK